MQTLESVIFLSEHSREVKKFRDQQNSPIQAGFSNSFQGFRF